MGPYDRRVDHHPDQPLAVGRGGHPREEPLRPPRGDPPPEPVVHGRPVARVSGQVAPGAADPGSVEDGLEEHAVGQVGDRAGEGLAPREHRPEDFPDLVGDGVSHAENEPSSRCPGVESDLKRYMTT